MEALLFQVEHLEFFNGVRLEPCRAWDSWAMAWRDVPRLDTVFMDFL